MKNNDSQSKQFVASSGMHCLPPAASCLPPAASCLLPAASYRRQQA
jgi:hypothetical protein